MRRAGLLLLAAAYLLVHVPWWLAGVRFDLTPLGATWQLLDPQLLRTDLAKSLFLLHAQPPLFNLLAAAALRTGHPQAFLQAFSLACGFALFLSLGRLQIRLGVRPALAWGLALAFAATPEWILYEHTFLYEFPAAALLLASVLLFDQLLERPSAGRMLSFASALAALALLRSVFHLAWVILAVAWALRFVPERRRLAFAAAGPVLLVAALYAKNALVFGRFEASSWGGLSAARITTFQLPKEERARLVAAGDLSPLALVPPGTPLEDYPHALLEVPPRFRGEPALAALRKSNGEPNYNHAGLLAITRRYGEDARWTLRHRPLAWLEGSARAWWIFARPAEQYGLLAPNLRPVAGAVELFDQLALVRLPLPVLVAGDAEVSLLLVVAIPLLFVAGWRRLRRSTGRARATLGLLLLDVAWVSLVVNGLETGENNRMRLLVDPLLIALAGLWVEGLLSRRRAA